MAGEATDEELMLRYRDGDVPAFEALYRRHKGGVYRYCLRQCRDRAVAEELFQDIWMKVINAREGYAVSARFTTWLYRIARNHLVDHHRRQRAAGAALAANDPPAAPAGLAAPEQDQPERRLEGQALGHRLLSLLAELPEEQRQVFLLREEGGLTVAEIADTVGVNLETAKSRLRYAINKLRAGLGDVP